MKKLLLPALAAACGIAWAKLPPPDEATKAKTAETAARAAWQAKVDLFQLCKSQDKIAAKYAKKDAKLTPVVAKPAAAGAPAAAASAAAPAASAMAAPASAAASGTPVAATAAIPPCADPGVFAYNAPEQKPLETSGAHSPSGTAASPPSVRPEAAKIQEPGKTSK